MKAVALMMLVGGWMIAVGGLLVAEATAMRMAMAIAGFGTSVAGVMTLNGTHVANAPWKPRGR